MKLPPGRMIGYRLQLLRFEDERAGLPRIRHDLKRKERVLQMIQQHKELIGVASVRMLEEDLKRLIGQSKEENE
jgi:hypothetical protein